MDITKKDLVSAAKTLNTVLGLDPAINVKAGVEELKEKLIEAGELLVPEDVLPEKVMAILGALGITIQDPEDQGQEEDDGHGDYNAEEADSEDEEDQDDPEDEDDAENGAENDDEEEEVKSTKKPKKEKQAKKPKKEKPAQQAKEPAKVKPEKKDPSTKITKKAIVESFINSKKGGTIEQMAQAIVDAGIDPDYEKNRKIVKLWLSKMGFKVTKAVLEQNPVFKR